MEIAASAQPFPWLRALLALPGDAEGETRPPQTQAGTYGTTAADFEAFFWRYEQRIYGYLWRMTDDAQAAHDLSQETFLRAWQHFAELRAAEAGNWLFRVASNLALTFLRRRHSPVGSAAPLDDFDAASSDPTGQFAERDAVRQTLMELTPHQRAALVLHEVFGLSCDEVGAALGVTRDAVKMALWRGREAFRRRYAQEDEA